MTDKVYIGQLDVRIALYENTRATSQTGSKEKTLTLFRECWAKEDFISGTEEEDGKIIALNVKRYVIRYNPTLQSKQITDMVLLHDNVQYNIYSVSQIGKKQFTVLKCSKRE